jgi:hypothetical protein
MGMGGYKVSTTNTTTSLLQLIKHPDFLNLGIPPPYIGSSLPNYEPSHDSFAKTKPWGLGFMFLAPTSTLLHTDTHATALSTYLVVFNIEAQV